MHTHTLSCYCLPPASPPTFDSAALRFVWFLGNIQKHEQCQRPTNTKRNRRSAVGEVTASGTNCRCEEINESKNRNRRKRNDGESFECCVPERLCFSHEFELVQMIKYFLNVRN